MTPKEFAFLVAHGAASELLRLGVPRPEQETVGVAVVECVGVRVIVSLSPYEGPATIAPETLARIEAFGAENKSQVKLSPRQQSIVDLLDREKPVKAEVIAMKLGKKTVRSALSDLCRFGVIRRVPGGGYVRT